MDNEDLEKCIALKNTKPFCVVAGVFCMIRHGADRVIRICWHTRNCAALCLAKRGLFGEERHVWASTWSVGNDEQQADWDRPASALPKTVGGDQASVLLAKREECCLLHPCSALLEGRAEELVDQTHGLCTHSAGQLTNGEVAEIASGRHVYTPLARFSCSG